MSMGRFDEAPSWPAVLPRSPHRTGRPGLERGTPSTHGWRGTGAVTRRRSPRASPRLEGEVESCCADGSRTSWATNPRQSRDRYRHPADVCAVPSDEVLRAAGRSGPGGRSGRGGTTQTCSRRRAGAPVNVATHARCVRGKGLGRRRGRPDRCRRAQGERARPGLVLRPLHAPYGSVNRSRSTGDPRRVGWRGSRGCGATPVAREPKARSTSSAAGACWFGFFTSGQRPHPGGGRSSGSGCAISRRWRTRLPCACWCPVPPEGSA